MAHLRHVLAISLFLAAPAAAQTRRALTEGLPASSNALYTDTTAVRVGVGTSSPGTTLDVQGSAQFGANVLKSTFNATPGATTYAVNLASGVKLANGCVSYSDGSLQCTASSGGGGNTSGFERNASGVVSLQTASDNVMLQGNSSMTIAGSSFSVQGGSFVVRGNQLAIGSNPVSNMPFTVGVNLMHISTGGIVSRPMQPFAKVCSSGVVNVANIVGSTLSWGTTIDNIGGMVDTDVTKLCARVEGRYTGLCNVQYSGPVGGSIPMAITVNGLFYNGGVTSCWNGSGNVAAGECHATATLIMKPGDCMQCWATQETGSPMNVSPGCAAQGGASSFSLMMH